jgi:uncharacterized protein YbcI
VDDSAQIRSDERVSGSIVAQISREVVRVHARYYGRGPTKAKAIWRHGIVVVILEEIFTKAEELLVESGQFQQVRSQRQAFQDQVEPLFCEVVERAIGQPVRAFLSQVTEEGVAAEVFVLDVSRGEAEGEAAEVEGPA